MNVANIMRDTAIAWIERYYTDEMRHLVLRQIRETELQVQTAQSGYGTGRNSQADFFAARAALVMLEDRLSEIDRQARNAALTLVRWIGPDANRTVATTPPPWQTSWLDGVALEAHLQHHPDLILLRATVLQPHETDVLRRCDGARGACGHYRAASRSADCMGP